MAGIWYTEKNSYRAERISKSIICMNTQARLILSYYQEISAINREHGVFLVRHIETGKICVKKVMHVFRAEVYSQLQMHPVAGTPRIYERIEDDGTLTIIEEFISGDSLETILASKGTLPYAEVLRIAIALCDILSELHSLRPPVIHRDIKPSNIILTSSGQVYLLDFNAARNYTSSKGEDTVLLGTHGYAAPEQYGFGESDPRTDIYAVGVLMQHLLTGSIDTSSSADQYVLNTGVPLSQTPVCRVIKRCTRLEPSERYPSAASLRRELAVLLSACSGRSSQGSEASSAYPRAFVSGKNTSSGSPAGSSSPSADGSDPAAASSLPFSANSQRMQEESPDAGHRMRSKYFPPGFRTAGFAGTVRGILCYLLLFAFWYMFIPNAPAGFLWFERISIAIMLIVMVLFSGNYLGILDKIRISYIHPRWLKIAVILLADILLFAFFAFLTGALEGIFIYLL